MIKRFFFLIVLSSAINMAYAEKTVVQWGGTIHKEGSDTYKIVSESEAHDKLYCEEPGSLSCCWQDGGDPVVISGGTTMHLSDVQLYVQHAIDGGELSGHVSDDNGINGFSWQGTDAHTFEIDFDGRPE